MIGKLLLKMLWGTLISGQMSSDGYHTPVLLKECIEGLNIDSSGVYVDVTFGGGGHSREIVKLLDDGKLLAFDQDEDAQENAIDDERFLMIAQNFRFLKNNLRLLGIKQVNGILADLGVSSHQFNEKDRGFSIRFDAELDMRMNVRATLSAKEIVNEYEQERLADVLWMYGEVKNARRLAAEIVKAREVKKISRVDQLKAIAVRCVNKKKENQYLAQVFQALRIEVNDELAALKDLLVQSEEVLAVGGRLVVMSYHSLEDRLVKNFMKTGNFEGKVEQDFFGNIQRPLQPIHNKVIVPSEEEVAINSRARSAKLRIAEKLKNDK